MKRLSVYILVALTFIGFLSCGRRGRDYYRRNDSIQYNNRKDSRRLNGKTVLSGTQIYQKCNSAVFTIFTCDEKGICAQGSGFFIDSKGTGISNCHVFDGMAYAKVQLADGRVYDVKEIVRYDEELDYIIFKVSSNKQKFNYLPISKTIPKVGEKVYAIGSPLGLENTLSSGEISSFRGGNNQIIQISVPIDHGSSGGALINSYGEVIGITSLVIDGSGANLNFAISIHVIGL